MTTLNESVEASSAEAVVETESEVVEQEDNVVVEEPVKVQEALEEESSDNVAQEETPAAPIEAVDTSENQENISSPATSPQPDSESTNNNNVDKETSNSNNEAPAESEQPQEEDSLTVTFVILPENFRHRVDIALTTTMDDVKARLARELTLELDTLAIKNDREVLNGGETLSTLGFKVGDECKLELVVEYKSKITEGLPSLIDVEVEQAQGSQPKLVQVAISVELDDKTYFGGFRNKKSGTIYHHACTQTPRKAKYTQEDRKYSRETQTYQMKSSSIQSKREASTQMDRTGIHLNEEADIEILPKPYETAEQFLKIKVAASIIIQCHIRGWSARRRAAYLKEKKEEKEIFLIEEEEKKRMAQEDHRRREIERRMKPRLASDFEILYDELEAWRLQETRKIKESYLAPTEQHAALQHLLYKETKLLQTIDRLKITANQENQELRIARMLNDMSDSKKWDTTDGNTVEVHTPYTTRAKELTPLYTGLNLQLLTTDERLDVLLHVKWTVKEFNCNLTRELCELIDREADLLNRGRHAKTLIGLRKRISNLFLAFIETPEFNPESKRYQISAEQAEF